MKNELWSATDEGRRFAEKFQDIERIKRLHKRTAAAVLVFVVLFWLFALGVLVHFIVKYW